ncbi:unnamed protein product [Rotaria magnacalcarata]|uniref:Uncharacterized protein n=1 Tax=Rotaria magnacalcarata TaxID=392030 RepID=A0A816T3J4_9BILA|nr:unnamed protein product [Rotaria magnacalcarata]
MLLFKNNSYSIYRFQRLLSLYQKNNETLSISSSVKLNATLKKLLDSKQYKEALDLFDQKFEKCTDFTIDMAIKACTISKDYKRGFHIQKRLSSNSLNNPFIQASLIRLYSRSFILSIGILLHNNTSVRIQRWMSTPILREKLLIYLFCIVSMKYDWYNYRFHLYKEQISNHSNQSNKLLVFLIRN